MKLPMTKLSFISFFFYLYYFLFIPQEASTFLLKCEEAKETYFFSETFMDHSKNQSKVLPHPKKKTSLESRLFDTRVKASNFSCLLDDEFLAKCPPWVLYDPLIAVSL